MYLFADGRDSEALQVLSTAPPIDSLGAASAIVERMLDKSVKRNLDPFIIRAFGIHSSLVDFYRQFMRFYDTRGARDLAREFALKLQAAASGDRRAQTRCAAWAPVPAGTDRAIAFGISDYRARHRKGRNGKGDGKFHVAASA